MFIFRFSTLLQSPLTFSIVYKVFLLSGSMCWIDWVMSTVPISEFDVDNEVTDSLGLRESGNDYQSINGLTEEECGVFRDNNPGLFRLAILN